MKKTQIEIYVVKTKIDPKNAMFLPTRDILEQKNLELLEIRCDLIKLFGGCTILPTERGYWFNPKSKAIEGDKIEIWRFLTSESKLKPLERHILEIRLAEIKAITEQTSQLYTINPDVEAIFI